MFRSLDILLPDSYSAVICAGDKPIAVRLARRVFSSSVINQRMAGRALHHDGSPDSQALVALRAEN